ncbi:MAG TPA: tRNA pseudouridine(55) synthase TruB [Gammaproteobacteria bacterium]
MTRNVSGRRKVTGIVLIDKPAGLTSNRVLQTVKRLFKAAKAGHTGSLDPLATGMLPVCLGEATKIAGLLLGARKTYRVEVVLGIATDTGDADGTVVESAPAGERTRDEIAAALTAFLGESEQTPPMYSALKHHGRRLYELARRGEEVERKPRAVTIHRIALEEIVWPRVSFVVECSKGTYVRSLAVDFASRLGTVGHVAALRRLSVAPYAEEQMIDVARLEALAEEGCDALDRVLLPADGALADWPELLLDDDQARRLRQGQCVPADVSWATGRVRLYAPGHDFMGVGNVLATGELKPQRLFAARD